MIIITDMNNLPHSCHDCRVNCGRFFKENGEYKRHPDCPLKEVSECEDCISRADAIKAMEDKAKKLTNEDIINGLCGAVAILYELPPSTPHEPRWIPVSERYPKIEDEYKYFLVIDDKGKVSVQEFYMSLDEEPQPYFSGMVNVIAWMPITTTISESEV